MNDCEKTKFWSVETFPQDFNPVFKNRIKIPWEIFPVGVTKFAVLDSNAIISCTIKKEVGNYIQKKVLNDALKENENPMGFYSLKKK